jgi:hypothetical protein
MINSWYKQSALRVFINGFPIEDDMGKMGKGFTSANEWEAVDIGLGDRPRPMYISAKLDPKYKKELIDY